MLNVPSKLRVATRAFWSILLGRQHSFADEVVISTIGNSQAVQKNINDIIEVYNEASMVEKKFRELKDILK